MKCEDCLMALKNRIREETKDKTLIGIRMASELATLPDAVTVSHGWAYCLKHFVENC